MDDQGKRLPWADRVEELFFRNGIRGVTMDDVASHLGISKKTLYQYVESKDDLIDGILEHHFTCRQHLADVLSQQSANAIEEFLRVLAHNLREVERMGNNLIHDLFKYHHAAWQRIQQFRQDYLVGWVLANIERGRREGVYRGEFNAVITARLHVAAIMTVFDPAWFPEESFPRPDVLRTFTIQFLHGIVSPEGLDYLKKNINHHE